MIRHRRALGSFVTVLAFGALLPASAAEVLPDRPDDAPTAEAGDVVVPGAAVYGALTGLPVGDPSAGAAGVVRSAIALASALRAVPLAEGSTDACPEERLAVSWDEPGSSYGHGALVSPLGPPPTAETTEVNGVVTCVGAPWAFMGFEARYVADRWDVVAVPFVDERIEDHDDHAPDRSEGDEAVTRRRAAAAAPLTALAFDGPIEGYARYEPQRTCSPAAKPGTLALQRFLMAGAPGSRNLGISRGCSIGGASEHKEGRAFDWGVLASRPGEAAAAEDFLARLLATDQAGNRHALARRMGVMYVIWDRQIWSAYRAEDGWRPYSGRSPHTDHVHISLSWQGALGRTSFWSGALVEGISFGSQPVQTASGPSPTAPPTSGPVAVTPPAPSDAPHRRPRTEDDAHMQREAMEDLARRQQHAAESEARQRQRAAAEELRRQERAAAEEARRQQQAWEEAVRQQERAAAEEARRQEEAAREELRQRARAAEEQARRDRQAVQKAPHAAPGPAAASAHGNGRGDGGGKGRGKGG